MPSKDAHPCLLVHLDFYLVSISLKLPANLFRAITSFGLFGTEPLRSEHADSVNCVLIEGECFDFLKDTCKKLRPLEIYVLLYLEDDAYLDSKDDPEVINHRGQFFDFDVPRQIGNFPELRFLKIVYSTPKPFMGPASSSMVVGTLARTLSMSGAMEELHLDVRDGGWFTGRPDVLNNIPELYTKLGGQPLRLRHLAVTKQLIAFGDLSSIADRLAGLASIVDVSALESLSIPTADECCGGYEQLATFDEVGLWRAVTDPTCFSALRRLSKFETDNNIFRLIEKVGMDPTLPPFS